MEQLSPVFTLPPEILSECFLSVAATVQYTLGMSTPAYAWITVSHVCRHWRVVALSFAKLWSRIRLNRHPDWMRELLNRSADTPLAILADFPLIYDNLESRADWMASFRVVLEHIACIRILLISSQMDLGPEVLDLLNRPAPLLKDLRLYNLVFDREEDARRLGLMLRKSKNACLESLSLCHLTCHIPWFELEVQTLKELTIVGLLPWSGVLRSLDMHTLVRILRSAPLLESFVLQNASRPLWTADTGSIEEPPVELPHLRRLELHGYTTDAIKLLDHLRLPALRSLFMALNAPLLDTPESFAASIVRTILALGELTSLHIKGEGYVNFTLAVHVARPKAGTPAPETNVFHITVSSTHCRRILSAFVVHPALSRVRTLHVTSLCRKRIWVLIFAHFRSVSELAVQGKRATKILRRMFSEPSAAASDAGEGNGEGEGGTVETIQVPFPHLRSLCLSNLREQDFTPGDDSHVYVQFWREKLEDRRTSNDHSLLGLALAPQITVTEA
ncbi:hypothetical protein C8Q72DRAFT_537032 [Fomitopsis betulina]|nr:hypothetical protein C8Q72DRAFT_537032 [Fomitopsis betulina]